MRRRVRFLRKARELAYRDLGGLVFNLHRFGQRNDPLVLAKLNLLGQIDNELRTLEHALAEHQPITVLREAGITACPRCAAIHSSEDRFCPRCGMPTGRHPDLPIAVAGAGADAPPSTPAPATAATRAPAAPPAPAPSAPSASPGPPPSTTSSPPSTPGRNAGANAQPAPVAATPSGAQHPTEQHDSVPADGPERAAATPREDITEVVRPSAKGP